MKILHLSMQDGTAVQIEIKKVGINNLQKLLDEKILITERCKLAVEKNPEFVDQLDGDSQFILWDEVCDLNEENLVKFMARQKKSLKALTGRDMDELMVTAMTGQA